MPGGCFPPLEVEGDRFELVPAWVRPRRERHCEVVLAELFSTAPRMRDVADQRAGRGWPGSAEQCNDHRDRRDRGPHRASQRPRTPVQDPAEMGSAYRRPAALPACLRPFGPCFVHDCVPLAACPAGLTGVPQGPVSIPRPGGRGGAKAITPARRDAAQEVAMLVDGGTRCHDSLLRHAARAIVASRPWREARDRQLRQTVPGGRKTSRVLRALARRQVATRSGEFEGKRRNAAETRAAQRTPPRGGLLELGRVTAPAAPDPPARRSTVSGRSASGAR